MTKSKRNRRKKPHVASSPEGSSSSKVEKLESLIKEAEAAVDSFNYDEAETRLEEILQVDTDNCKCLEMLASIYIEKFQWPEAVDLLKKCIDISPEDGFSKYFSIAQLSEGLESASFYQKGIQVLLKQLENGENIDPSTENNKKALLRSLSDAYCSISEIFMSDCCYEEDAEQKCFESIDSAIHADSSNPEAFQCLASFQVTKDQIEEAKESLQKSISFWLPTLEDLDELDAEKELQNIPTYDSRIKTSKLLMEVEMFYEATRVLETLLEEDDEVVEVWYLLGWCNYIQGEEYKRNAQFYLRKAKEVSAKGGYEEDECIQHVNELLKELDAQYPNEDEDEKEEDTRDESDFSSDSESDNEMET